MRLFISIDP